jgi:prepilin-type N-terminal cleavage/methylation domain-containing protein
MIVARRKQGFTLIEVIVVMAIISIMAGIMVPMVYRVWESNDEALTKDRMADLRIALVGDAKLYQNGVRTHFGYVGYFGHLPETLDQLVLDAGGPYLPAGFDPSNYGKDAWANDIDYAITATDTLSDGTIRRIATTLTSYGPDGIPSPDDIAETIYETDVVPVITLQGNVGVTFQSAYASRRIGVAVDYRKGDGTITTDTYCDVFSAMTGSAGFTSQAFTFSASHNLPIGIVTMKPRVYDNACTTYVEGTPLMAATNISGGLLFMNLQIKSVP